MTKTHAPPAHQTSANIAELTTHAFHDKTHATLAHKTSANIAELTTHAFHHNTHATLARKTSANIAELKTHAKLAQHIFGIHASAIAPPRAIHAEPKQGSHLCGRCPFQVLPYRE